ncbi:family UPF0642 protein [Rutstroemia sp. NJR-2017a BBW]|nr:family UPF0642 protein [Rutstroemia sp. NJR-2017a BBW]
MAKGARASTKKANHAALKAKVFGPVENARAERLHAKLMELASQPKPSAKAEDVDMDGKEGKDSAEGSGEDTSDNNVMPTAQEKQSEEMEVDKDNSKPSSKTSKNRIFKKRSSRHKTMTFTTYKNGKKVGGRVGKAKK